MIGQTVSHYRVMEKLGGGMGVLCNAEETRVHLAVAPVRLSCKTRIDPGSWEFIKGFLLGSSRSSAL